MQQRTLEASWARCRSGQQGRRRGTYKKLPPLARAHGSEVTARPGGPHPPSGGVPRRAPAGLLPPCPRPSTRTPPRQFIFVVCVVSLVRLVLLGFVRPLIWLGEADPVATLEFLEEGDERRHTLRPRSGVRPHLRARSALGTTLPARVGAGAAPHEPLRRQRLVFVSHLISGRSVVW